MARDGNRNMSRGRPVMRCMKASFSMVFITLNLLLLLGAFLGGYIGKQKFGRGKDLIDEKRN